MYRLTSCFITPLDLGTVPPSPSIFRYPGHRPYEVSGDEGVPPETKEGVRCSLPKSRERRRVDGVDEAGWTIRGRVTPFPFARVVERREDRNVV